MLVDRYDPVDLFTQIPGLTLHFNPVLAHLDQLLDDEQLFQQVKAAMATRHRHSLTRGRHATPVEVVLRMLVVQRLYRWSYEETEYHVSDSLILRRFCRVYAQRVPDDTTLIKWSQWLGPATLEALHARVVDLAVQARVTRGRKLRVDTTVVPTNIHPPTDSSLLTDAVRVLARLGKRAQTLLTQVGAAAALGKEAFRDRTRSMRRRGRELRQVSRRKGESKEGKRARLQAVYAGMLAVAQQSQRQATRVRAALAAAQADLARAGDQLGRTGQRLAAQLAACLPKVEQVIQQAWRRTQAGEVVPAGEKTVSLFEGHTQIIQRGKARKATDTVEFGRKVWLGETEGGLISDYAVLPQPNQDATYLPERLAQHQTQFGQAPSLLTGDRGLSSAENVAAAERLGVQRVVLPALGKPPPEQRAREKERWFRRGYRWRAGIEGRISLLQRRFGLDRCRNRGAAGLERWVGWGILAHNLWQIARAQAAR
jgi:IS5 family transposase